MGEPECESCSSVSAQLEQAREALEEENKRTARAEAALVDILATARRQVEGAPRTASAKGIVNFIERTFPQVVEALARLSPESTRD